MPNGEPTAAGHPVRGFAYLLLLVMIAVLALAAAGAVSLGHSMARRQAEQALLVAGDSFRAALASYRSASPPGNPAAAAGPAELADLLRDPRLPGVRRHLRQVPADPMTGRADWGLLRDANGRILAVHSLAPGQPIKRTGFDTTQAGFEQAERYDQWLFGAQRALPPRAAASAASAAGG